MTSKISLFNKGIYKSSVRRYLWGSVLYFIILFMCTGMLILMTDKRFLRDFESVNFVPLVLQSQYIVPSILVGMVVPTIVALLLFRFVHSKKLSIFIHSLPVTRTANYVSTLAAGLTLMAVPIVLNGMILMLISFCGYERFFGVGDCMAWIGINLLTVFLMFSASSFVSMLTGNSFAMIGLNALLHCFVIIVAAGFSSLADCFVYGYYEENMFLNGAVEWNFVGYLVGLTTKVGRQALGFDVTKLILMMVLAVGFYLFGWVLYKKRRMETAEDVAAFGCLNPIYKYLVTLVATLGAFGLASYYAAEAPAALIAILAIVSLVVYFGSEMLLKKSLRVWKAYKGFLVFAAVVAAVGCVFICTTFFGFETRIPDAEDIESVAIYDYYYQEDEPYSDDTYVIETALKAHEELVKDEKIYTVKTNDVYYYSGMHIRYKLKNGRALVRRYPISEEDHFAIMESLHKSEEYKMKKYEIFMENIKDLTGISFAGCTVTDDKSGLVECLKKDILSLDHSQMDAGEAWDMTVSVDYVIESKNEDEAYVRGFSIPVNANFKNTIAWMLENGYSKNIFNSYDFDLCILNKEQHDKYFGADSEIEGEYADYNSYSYVSSKEVLPLTFEEMQGVERLSDAERKEAVRDFVITHGVRYNPEEEYGYYLCLISDHVSVSAAFYEEDGKALLELLEQ